MQVSDVSTLLELSDLQVRFAVNASSGPAACLRKAGATAPISKRIRMKTTPEAIQTTTTAVLSLPFSVFV